MAKEIHVTHPYLPPLDEFVVYLEQIWASGRLTNNGPFHAQLEQALTDYLGVEYVSLFSNGTLALVTALQAMKVTGEVITTPFSFVATTHAINWNGIRPVFADVDPVSLCLSPEKIEAAITPQTTAILPVHVYGTPCDVEEIQRIADIYGLKVIYDAAHAFGVKIGNISLLNFGDFSVLSFHATKVFNTFEGGAIISHDAKTKKRIDYLKNFGFADEVTVMAPGINGKMNEVQAAMGLVQLQHFSEVLEARATVDARYRAWLSDVPGLRLHDFPENVTRNYAYFPVFVEEGFTISRDALYDLLRKHNIYARRYFYPLISSFPMYRGLLSARPENLPVSTKVAEQVLCLPIYPALLEEEQRRIVQLILDAAQGRV